MIKDRMEIKGEIRLGANKRSKPPSSCILLYLQGVQKILPHPKCLNVKKKKKLGNRMKMYNNMTAIKICV